MYAQEAFNDTWNRLAGRESNSQAAANFRQRLARVKFAERYKGYFLAANGNVGANTLNAIVTMKTQPLTFPALVLDANAVVPPFAEIEITRSNPSRTQISNEYLWNNLYTTASVNAISSINASVFAETFWPQPFGLEINELLRVRTRQTVAAPAEADTEQGLTFRVVGLNRQPCPPAHWEEVEEYIQTHREQKPVLLTTFSEDARTFNFPKLGTDERTIATTREAREPMLLESLCFSRPFFASLDPSGGDTKAKVRIVDSSGHSFTPQPVLLQTLFQFSGFSERGPGGGWHNWTQLPVPHYVPKGGTITVEITDAVVIASTQNVYELLWRGSTI